MKKELISVGCENTFGKIIKRRKENINIDKGHDIRKCLELFAYILTLLTYICMQINTLTHGTYIQMYIEIW